MNPELLSVLVAIVLVVPILGLWILEIVEARKYPTGKPFYTYLWRPIILVGAIAGALFWLLLKLGPDPRVEFWSFFLAGLFFGIFADRIVWYLGYRKRHPSKSKKEK